MSSVCKLMERAWRSVAKAAGCSASVFIFAGLHACKVPAGAGPIQTPSRTPVSSSVNAVAPSTLDPKGDGCPANVSSCTKESDFNLIDIDGQTVVTAISAQQGVTATYAFKGKSTHFEARLFTVYQYQQASASTQASMSDGGSNGSAGAKISWTPNSNDPVNGNLTVTVRDMTACRRINSANTSACDNFKTRIDAADTDKSLAWNLVKTTQTTTTGSSNNAGLGVILGVLTGVLGGGYGGVIGSLGSMILGGGMGGTTTTAYPTTQMACPAPQPVTTPQQCSMYASQGCYWNNVSCVR